MKQKLLYIIFGCNLILNSSCKIQNLEENNFYLKAQKYDNCIKSRGDYLPPNFQINLNQIPVKFLRYDNPKTPNIHDGTLMYICRKYADLN